jgi:Family of unknown function (DUF6058)
MIDATPDSPDEATTVRFAGSINEYLHRYFCSEATLAAECGIAIDTLGEMISSGMLPQPAYVVSDGRIVSHVFGGMDAAGAPEGRWFSPSNAAWLRRALAAIAEHGRGDAADALRARFKREYGAALRASHTNDGPLPGITCADGNFDEQSYEASFDAVWQHFLAGTFSLCVRGATDEVRIAEKESLQMRLAEATDNGEKLAYTPSESKAVRCLIERYLLASMPFSPVEYARSSRKRLVEDVLGRLSGG